MSEAKAAREHALVILGRVLLVAALVAAYANHFHNSFHFDDAHTVVNNAAIRELRNVPRFFLDATTFSSLPSNQSYRPLVSTLLAIDYAAGDLKPFWFHLSIFALLLVLVLLLTLVLKDLLEQTATSRTNIVIALAAAALYGLHPANADTVNYVIASAEIMSALGIVGSFALYFAFPNLRLSFVFTLPAAVAILAKPPAAIFPALFAVYVLLFGRSESRLVETRRQRVAQIFVPFLICGAMLLFVQAMTPHTWVSGAARARDYLITQPCVALLYFKTFFWPGDLSADYDMEPLTGMDDSRFWAGSVFVVLLVTMSILCARYKQTRVISFGLLWFLIALLPTSLYPLAEVMNDHRTFVSYIGLVIALAGAGELICSRVAARRAHAAGTAAATVLGAIVLLILWTSGYATFQRNKVWRTEETLWRDVTIKSPRNPRGLMNYGNTLMAKGDFAGALDYFRRAFVLAPQYSVLLINLAIAEDATGQSSAAEQHFQEALRLAPSSPDSYSFYARALLARARVAEARGLLQSALQLSPTDVTARDLLAQADALGTQPDTPESYLVASLQHYQAGRFAETIAAAEAALKLRPDYAEAWNNICAAQNKLTNYTEAAAACEQALRLKPNFELARNNLKFAQQMAGVSPTQPP
jgi:tetratricopeptide (TPR) repeat protein